MTLSKIALYLCLFFILSKQNALSYPIFYSCQNEEIKLTEKIDFNNSFEKTLLLNKKEQEALFEHWCQGIEDCQENLKFITTMAKINHQTMEKAFLEELQKIKKNSNFKLSDDRFLDISRGYRESYLQLQACQNTTTQLNPQDYITPNGDLIIPYPYHSNYMYITGCRSVNTKKCEPMDTSSVDQVIAESIAMGTDPYLALAINLMENDAEEMSSLYLDPIAVMDSLECSGQQVQNNSTNALNSYGTSYQINASVIKNNNLSSRIENFLKIKENKTKEYPAGKSYYCYDTLGKTNPNVFNSVQDRSCCLELGFQAEAPSSTKISQALVYHYINRITRRKFRDQSEPEWRIQRFNGYTNLMGAAEGVPAWRAGINFYHNPIYGQQAMDYILNALMFHPYIRKKVEEQSQRTKDSWKSILCRGKENGTYYYDSEHYFNLVKNAKRFEAIEQQYKKGIKFSELSTRERSVLLKEFYIIASKEHKHLLNPALRSLYTQEIYRTIEIENDLFITTGFSREQTWEQAKKINGLTREDFDLTMDFYEMFQDYNENRNKWYDEMITICNAFHNRNESQRYNECRDHSDKLFSRKDSNDIPQNSNVFAYKAKFDRLHQERTQFETQTQFNTRWSKILQKLGGNIYFIIAKMRNSDYKDLPSALTRLRKKEGYTQELEQKIIALYNDAIFVRDHGLFASVLNGEAYSQYFQNSYSQRDTLEEVSDYNWQRLSPEQAETIVGKLSSKEKE